MAQVADCAGFESKHVWEEHVSRRTPCLFSSLPSDVACLSRLVSLKSLTQQKEEAESLKVEMRAETGRAFGNGQKQSMKLHSFLKQLSKGNKDLYLTTQEALKDSDGFPELLSVPLKGLVDEGLPLKPAVMGNLVPQAINLWMGCSGDGSSSGLHHDFHDNLYVLICGRKRFRLYPPNTATTMYTHGQVKRVHENGRIMYEGQGAVHADGSDEADLRRWRLKRFADSAHIPNTTTYEKRKRSRAGSDEGVGRSGASTKQDKPPKSTGLEWSNGAGEGASMDEECMQGAKSPQQSGEAGGSHVSREGSDIEDALEAALEAAACGDVGFSSEEEWCRSSDDADADRASGAGVSEKESVEDGCEDGCSFSELEEGSRMRARGSGGGCGGDGTTGKVRRAKTKAHDAKTSAGAGGRKIAAGDDDTAPESFSQIDLALPEAEIKRRFPQFPGVGEALEVTVEAGQALYLPASWFHEVTSFGGADNCMHVAVNYWFHPPDRLTGYDAAECGVTQEAEGLTCTKKQKKNENVPGGEVGKKKGKKHKKKTGAVHDAHACAVHVEVEPLESAGKFPYKTDFWPSMWNARVERHAWPQHLKVPLSGCE